MDTDAGEMDEDEVDANLEELSPASDPPSWTLGTDHREELTEDETTNVPGDEEVDD